MTNKKTNNLPLKLEWASDKHICSKCKHSMVRRDFAFGGKDKTIVLNFCLLTRELMGVTVFECSCFKKK